MSNGQTPGERAQSFFDQLWSTGDPWALETAEYDQGRDDYLLTLLADRRYDRALEVGCGAGVFSAKLTRVVDDLVAVDVSALAIEAARKRDAALDNVRFCVANIMDYDIVGEGPWDLIVLSETIYYVGWLYPYFDVAWLAHQLFVATRPGGRLLLVNSDGGEGHYLHQRWILQTYQDLFVNVGYQVERQEIFRGSKNGADCEAIMVAFAKPDSPSPEQVRL
jgi:predicted TPR repeat methyltransferase